MDKNLLLKAILHTAKIFMTISICISIFFAILGFFVKLMGLAGIVPIILVGLFVLGVALKYEDLTHKGIMTK